MRLEDLAKTIDAELEGDPAAEVTSCGTLAEAVPGQVSFLASAKYASKLAGTRATAIIVSPNVRRPANGAALLRAKDPYYAFRNAVVALHGFRKQPVWDAASPSQSPTRDPQRISPLAYVDPTAEIGEGTIIYPFVFVGADVKVGRDCILYPSVTIYDSCVLGDRVILHAGTSIGNDGFGHATHALPHENGGLPTHHKIPQSGIVVIEDDVEMGSNCTVDRATIGVTVIGRGTKCSNNVVIGHGSKIGPHNLFAGQVGIAGTTTTGAYVAMGGQVGIAGHLRIADQVQIGAQSGVMEDIDDVKGIYIGYPALPAMHAKRVYSQLANLDEIAKKVRELERRLAELEPK